jgi:hypothetical protein
VSELSADTCMVGQAEGAKVAMGGMGGLGPASQIPSISHTLEVPEAQAWEQKVSPQEAQVLTKRTG